MKRVIFLILIALIFGCTHIYEVTKTSQAAKVDTQNNSTIDSVIINGKSRWGTFGGDHPQDLLHEPIGQYVDSLFE
jgi:hypothetical protein